MVLSLPVPSFSRSTSTSPTLRSSNSNSNQSTTLSEALRNNPFGNTSRSRAIAALTSSTQTENQRQEQEELNNALETLARIFPDVKVEVFRELLVRFDGQSRLQVCVEQLLRHKNEWVAGRWNVPAGSGRLDHDDGDARVVPPEERFRSDEYKASVKVVLSKEFSALSRSTVEAVLAEANFCYVRARPTLKELSRRTWRATFNSLFPSFKRKKDKDEHPMVVWQRRADGEVVPRLKETGCAELDRELHEALLAPLLRAMQEVQEERDFRLAEELNVREAQDVEALYECECCLADVTFEQISACSASSHIICYSCIQRTIHEALFGQGWGKSVDVERSTLRCIAPIAQGSSCDGSLSPEIVKRAILLEKAGSETYCKFETRLASESLLKSQLKLVRCPFCSYAEVDPVYHPPSNGIAWRFRRDGLLSTVLMAIVLLDMIPLLAIPLLILWLLEPTAVSSILKNSLLNLSLKVRPKRFTCASPLCRRVSCITCQKPWRDPHICHEPLLLDLRATVEAARTAAVKRTCPRCGLSFVKSSGCNKLTCVCGYSMCYLCRKALGPSPPAAGQRRALEGPGIINQENVAPGLDGNDEHADVPEGDEPAEGYRHFCEHFRLNPGSRCGECNKCDLYQAEDEEAVVRRAGERAEREWRARQGITAGAVGVGALQVNKDFSAVDSHKNTWGIPLQGQGHGWDYWLNEVWCDGRWKMEGQTLVDWLVEQVVVIEQI